MFHPICAIASPLGKSAVGIIRITGSDCIEIISKLFKPFSNKIINLHTHHKKSIFGTIIWNEQIIDEVLILPFVAPYSYTGEDSIEIYTHGNPLILKNILGILYKNNISPAEPGEFTKRAFLSGKIDISEAEAVREIIEAKSNEALQGALRMKQGKLRNLLTKFRSNLLNIIADASAELDFIDEGLEFSERQTKNNTILLLIDEAKSLLQASQSLKIYREGVEIVIFGAPNVGKSTLLNYFVGEKRAIVSNIPGTTRDYLEIDISLDGIPTKIIDTAGIRKIYDDDENLYIEKLGIEQSIDKANKADIIILLMDTSIPLEESILLSPFEELHKLQHQSKIILVCNKIDTMHASWNDINIEFFQKRIKINIIEIILISVIQEINLDLFRTKIKNLLNTTSSHSEGLTLSSWQEQILENIIQSLQESSNLLIWEEPQELFVSSLQNSIDLIAQLTGKITEEDIIGRIFSRFCIGK